MVLCPTVRHNKTYQQCPWIWTDPGVYLPDPGERLHDYLRAFYHVFIGEPTLYIIDDCSASTALTKKKRHVVNGCFLGPPCRAICLGPHSKIHLCPEGLARADALGLFHCKNRDSFEDCLRENEMIPSREQRVLVRQQLAETKHAKFLLKTDQPVGHTVLSDVKQ